MFTPVKDRIEYGGAMIGKEEKDAINRVIDSQGGRRWTMGEESQALEEELAQTVGMKRAVLTNSGSSALLVALASLHLPKGSYVMIPALNFPTAFNAIIQNGLIPYVVDIDPNNLLIDLREVKKVIDRGVDIKAVIAVNIASNPVDLVALRRILGLDCKIILDNCLAKGTLVKTINGDVPIEDIKVGDKVLTRKGYKRVLRHMYKGVQPVMTRFGVTATSDHPFITTRGKVDFHELQPSDILYSCNLPTKETNTIDILNQNTGIREFIGTAQVKDMDIYTDTFGKINTDKSQTGIGYTIEMETRLTTMFQILKRSLQKNILNYISKKMEDMRQQLKTLIKQELQQQNGINLAMVGSFMPNTTSGSGVLEGNPPMFALCAKEDMKPTGLLSQSFAQGVVSQKAEVYDLTVEDAHEFFANGILVSNCDGFGTLSKRKFVETYADLACTSFHAAHIITMGEGGAIFTDDEELADRCRKLREWGRASGTDRIYEYPGFPDDYRERYVYEEIGWNLKPLELQSAMGRVQLKKLADFRIKRINNFERLYKGIEDLTEYNPVFWDIHTTVCWFSFPIICNGISREAVMNYLEENNIECRTIFSGNILKHPAYKDIEYAPIGKEFPEADNVMTNGLFLSVHPSITDEMIDFMIKCLREVAGA